jgi:hypothetical protein
MLSLCVCLVLLANDQTSSNTISEQTRLLRAPENQQKIQNVVDDASTIRAARSQRASTVSPSVKSGGASTTPSRAFPWDDELLRTDAYQNATLHQRSKSDSRRELAPRRPDLNIQIQDHLSSDEGYETMSRTTSDSMPSGTHCMYGRIKCFVGSLKLPHAKSYMLRSR